jgi:hypothetical protein
MEDKNKIWTDCAQCAYKHLSAAYAMISAFPGARKANPDTYCEWQIYVARAIIAVNETANGYKGNIDLAAGCLAAAELEPAIPYMTARLVRAARMDLLKGATAKVFELPATEGAFIRAHLTEAARELPGLLDDGARLAAFDRVFKDWDAHPEVADELTGLIQWIRETYELGGANETEKSEPARQD